MEFKQVVIYGHKLHSHTHSYIHNAFYRAFQNLNYNTIWLDDNDDLSGIDFSNSLFITEGQVCKNMPLIKGNKYILHNCYDDGMWNTINAQGIDYLKLQVYTDDVLNYTDAKLLEPCIYHDSVGKIFYMPWATDLLPDEISLTPSIQRINKAWWVGTMGTGTFGNMTELSGFIHACKENGVEFEHANNLSVEENRQRIAQSYMAPAIVGTWQKSKGYIPCRIFKNISYGQFGITNSAQVQELFEGKLIYSENEYELFAKMQQRSNSPTYQQELVDLITFVKEKHTYINRIKSLLSVL